MRRHEHHHFDPASRRVYGPTWLQMIDVVDLHPNVGPVGLITLVGLCSVASDDELVLFGKGLARPLPGKAGEPPAKWLRRHFPRGADEAFEPDTDLLAWAREDAARRLWAFVCITWGLEAGAVMSSFKELTSLGAHPRPIGVDAVSALAGAAPRQIPPLLRQGSTLDVVCTAYATDAGVPGGNLNVVLPAALSATASALAHDPLQGIAACALLIQSKGAAEIDRDRLEHTGREGTPTAALAGLLARLWRSVRGSTEHDD